MADPNEQPKPDEAPEPAGSVTTSESSSGADEGAADGADASRAAEPAPAKRVKKKARSEGEASSADRNRRIREEAAAKRRAKREDEARRAAPARNLDATEIVDDALVRSMHAAGNWIKRNANTIQWVVLAAVVGGLGYQIYSYRQGRAVDLASEEIASALHAEFGRVGPQENPEPDRYSGLLDLRKEFPTDAARLSAAEAEFRKAEAATRGPTSALATLGLAGVLYDQGKYKDAQAAYEKVKNSELATKDRDARGRAIEGIGLSLEAQGQLDGAIKAFQELANTDIPGLKDLGTYHQARLLARKGERDKAKDLLKKLLEKLSKDEDKTRDLGAPPSFLEAQARELLASVDPSAVPKPAPGGGLTAEQLERLKQQIKAQGSSKIDPEKLDDVLKGLTLGSAAPDAPAAPDPAPDPAPTPAGSAE